MFQKLEGGCQNLVGNELVCVCMYVWRQREIERERE